MFRYHPRVLLTGILMSLVALGWAATYDVKGSKVLVNGVTVIEILTASDGIPPETRAGIIAANLETLPASGTIDVHVSGEFCELVVGSSTILTVDKIEAAKHGTTPESLARSWAIRLRDALSMPPLKLDTDEATVPLGSVKKLHIYGFKAKFAKAESNNNAVAKVEALAGTLKISALAEGFAGIILQSGDAEVVLNVHVKPWAALLPQTIGADVIGAPATVSAVRGSVEYALRTAVSTLPHATTTFELPTRMYSIQPGKARTYQVPFRARAPGAFESLGSVSVVVRNSPLPRQADAELWYDNAPEQVKKAGPLFASYLRPGVAARLLYHHVNSTSQGMFVRIEAINDSDVSAKLALIPGDSAPDRNPVLAGLQAGDRFLRSWAVGSGEVLTIPPHETIPISLRRLSPTETMSGVCSMRLVSGPTELLVRVDSWPPFPLETRWQNAVASATPWREVGANPVNAFDDSPFENSIHIYPNPYKSEKLSYVVGGRFGFVRIGQKPLQGNEGGDVLDGNFGVIYDIAAVIDNPTPTATDVEIVFEASAGYCGGLFMVDGTMMRTPLMMPKQEARIARFRLPPGVKRRLTIMTMPLSGSSYPVTLTIRPFVADKLASNPIVSCIQDTGF